MLRSFPMWTFKRMSRIVLGGQMRIMSSRKDNNPNPFLTNNFDGDFIRNSSPVMPWKAGLTKKHMNAVVSMISEMKASDELEQLKFVAGKVKDPSSMDYLLEQRNFDAIFALYKSDRAKLVNCQHKSKVIKVLLKMCQTGDDLYTLHSILEDMQTYKVPSNEAAFEAQVRCYIAFGDHLNAMDAIKNMIFKGYIPQSESLVAMMDQAISIKNTSYMRAILKIMYEVQAYIPPEKIGFLFEILQDKESYFLRNCKLHINYLMKHISHKMFGITDTDMVNMVSQMSRMSPEKIHHEGVLVSSLDDIPGTILNEMTVDKECKQLQTVTVNEVRYFGVHPYVAAYQDHPVLMPASRHIPVGGVLGQNIGTPKKKAVETKLDKSRTRIYTVLPADKSALSEVSPKVVNRRARIVLPSAEGCCPNCDYQLYPLEISDMAKARARMVLLEKEWSKGGELKDSLTEFVEWLKKQPQEFSVIINGYNVGFDPKLLHKNRAQMMSEIGADECVKGFNRVKRAVSLIKAQDPNHKVLVVFPFIDSLDDPTQYLQMQSAINSLCKECEVYMVPKNATDDHYLFMAVLYEERKTKGLFLTNNNMRLLSDLFEPRVMMRWRFAHQILWKETDEISLQWPAKFTRDFQLTPPPNKRWHIPSLSGSEWLCLKL